MNVARLLVPALRWDASTGFRHEWPRVEAALARGVGGFILFGGEAGAVRDLCQELRAAADYPLLIGSDLERGAGQQFRGATPLPPAAALASLEDPAATRRAGEITARDARALGVNWIYAPTADIDLEPDNPIIGTRAFGADAGRVSAQVSEWIRGCHAGGALACAKHFPGHGRTTADSHAEKPVVAAPREALEDDLMPFRAAIEVGVDSVMTAHVAYPAYDPSGRPATLSRPLLQGLLREQLGFDGLVVTDALIMEGFIEDLDEAGAAVEAISAGCDMLLYPDDMDAVVEALEAALADGRLDADKPREALRRVNAALDRVAEPAGGSWGREEDLRWALETAIRTLRVVRGTPRLPDGPVRLVEVDDDVGGPYPPYSRAALPAALRRAGVELSETGTPLIALYSDIRAWKGRPGISADSRAAVERALADATDATVLLFGHPRLADDLTVPRHLLAAWGGEGLMQEAVAARLTGRSGGLPSAQGGLDR